MLRSRVFRLFERLFRGRGFSGVVRGLVGAGLCGALVFSFSQPTFAISDTKKGSISTNCRTIKQTLNQIARNDSRARVYLGTAYEDILTNFMTPLNIRLTKNNQPSTSLIKIQSDFITKRAKFTTDFTDYMRSLEELTGVDCQKDPEKFYEKLETTRTKRANLQKSALETSSLVYDHLTAVGKLKEGL